MSWYVQFGTLSMAAQMGTIGVEIDCLFIPAMTEDHNSENSTHEQDVQRVTPERPEAAHNTYATANGSNGSSPSREQASNPSQRAEETIEAIRSNIYEAQATNEVFRNQNIALNQRIIRITRENREYRQQHLDLITHCRMKFKS